MPAKKVQSTKPPPPLSNYFISNDKFSREAIQPANRTNNFQSSVGPVSRHHRSRTRTTRSFSQETAKRKGPREERKRKKMKEQKEKQRNWSRGRERRTAGGSSRRLVLWSLLCSHGRSTIEIKFSKAEKEAAAARCPRATRTRFVGIGFVNLCRGDKFYQGSVANTTRPRAPVNHRRSTHLSGIRRVTCAYRAISDRVAGALVPTSTDPGPCSSCKNFRARDRDRAPTPTIENPRT